MIIRGSFVIIICLKTLSLNDYFTSVLDVDALAGWLSVELAAVEVVEGVVANFDNFVNSCRLVVVEDDGELAGWCAAVGLVVELEPALVLGDGAGAADGCEGGAAAECEVVVGCHVVGVEGLVNGRALEVR